MQAIQSMQDTTMQLGKGMLNSTKDTTLLLGKGMLTTTIATTKGAGNMFVDGAQKTTKSISSLVHDSVALALHGEEAEEEDVPPVPLFVPTSWEPKENPYVVSKTEVGTR